MTDIQFEWDEAKNRSNQRKHGVSFEIAREVFRDPLCLSLMDSIVSGEERWQTFGMIDGVLLLVVVHTTSDDLDQDLSIETIRIISARKVTRSEREIYEEDR